MMNRYYLSARLAPAVLTSVPIYTAYYSFVSPFLESKSGQIQWIAVTGDITMSVVLIYLLIQLNRITSKEVFQRIYFKDEMQMPTTEYLLHKNDFYTSDIKSTIGRKIKKDFELDLFDANRESVDEGGARKQVMMAVSQIRSKLRENKMVLQHNIEYGFFRNFTGGCIIAVLISIGMALLFKYCKEDKEMFFFSIGCVVFYVIPLLLSKIFIVRYGRYYAKILYEQYLSAKD